MNRKRKRLVWTLLATLLSLFLLFPVYWMFQTAISPTDEILSRNPRLLLGAIDLTAVRSLLSEEKTYAWFRNSGIVTAVSAIVATVAATLAGFALSRYRARGTESVTFVMFLGRILPGTLVALPFFVMFRLIGLLGTLPAVIIANTSVILPFATLLMKSYFDSVPRDLDNAARVDGCTMLGALWRVILPVAKTGVAATLAFAATASWVDLLFARTLVLREELWTVPVGIASFASDIFIDWNGLMALGSLSVIPVFVLYWFVQPYIVSGFTAGAVKG